MQKTIDQRKYQIKKHLPWPDYREGIRGSFISIL